MKQVTTLLTVTLLFFASVAFSQAVNNTLKNFNVSGGTYTMEIWTQYKSGTFYISHGEFAVRNANRPDDLGMPTVTFEPRFGGAGWVGVTRFTPNAPAGPSTYSWTVNFSSIIPSSLGEKVCTISFPILHPSATAVISWGTPYPNNGYTGFQGVINNNSGSDSQVLPIQLASFKVAMLTGNAVTLSWTTASETNNFGFYVQRDGVDLAFIAGNGTTIQQHTYSYTDNPSPGRYQYRLKQVDLDGTTTLSESIVIDVNLPAVFALNQNYPNPFNPTTTIRYGLPQKSSVQLAVFNTLGQQVANLVDGEQEAGYHEVVFDATGLSSGVYFCRLRAGDFVESKRLLLIR